MNRLVLVPCIVVASYVAFASFMAWSPIVYELGRLRRLNIPTSVANRNEIRETHNSPTEPSFGLPSYEVPNRPVAITEKSATAILPETPYHESIWVTVLLPARVHTGPSIDTPTIHFYAVGTPLRALRYQRDWFEIMEPGTSKSGWIYRKYLGAIGNSEQSTIASREAQDQRPTAQPVPVKRYAKAIPVKRYANGMLAKHYASAIRFSKQSTRFPNPVRDRTEMASLLQRAFSGY